MSDELRELYQEVILDHNRRPRNFGVPEGATGSADGYNPLCGDKVSVHVCMEGGVLKALGFQGSGCAISTASASLMTERLKGLNQKDAEAVVQGFLRMVTADASARAEAEGLGKLEALAGVREFPMRIKCATLCWHTLKAALDRKAGAVSTE